MFLAPTKRRNVFSALDDIFTEWDANRVSKTVVPVEVVADEQTVHVTAELPGIDKKDIAVEYKDGILKISGEKKEKQEKKEKNYYYSEISTGYFSRQIEVGPNVDFERANAQYKDGVLTIDIPKAKAPQTNRLEVK